MRSEIRELVPLPVMRLVPPPVKWTVRRQLSRWRGRLLARHLRSAGAVPRTFLGLDALEALQRGYPAPKMPRYTAEALVARGAERATFLQQVAAPMATGRRVRSLEIGCLDGMVSGTLQEQGWQATAIDRVSCSFDSRAHAAGAMLMAMDVSALSFPDDSFDFLFSYDAFEHLEDPRAALEEMVRVTTPGGLIYLNFGPLYNSAFGLHAYRSVRVPFCQFLFEPATLDAFCRHHKLPPIKYQQLNGWSLAQFRGLWRSCGDRLRRLRYNETWSSSGLELVERYPQCFASAVDSLEELSVAHIEVLFRVKKR